MKKILSIILVVTMLVSSIVVFAAETKDFTDIKGHWGESAIRYIVDQEYLKGY